MPVIMNALKEWRMNLPEDQRPLRQAAVILGVSYANLSRYERGEKMNVFRALHFEKVTGIPRSVLRPDLFDKNA